MRRFGGLGDHDWCGPGVDEGFAGDSGPLAGGGCENDVVPAA